MATKTFTVRVPQGAPEITSEQAAQWLETTPPDKLATDPGAGERTLRLSLDAHTVKASAKAAGEPEATFLRRLIATNVRVPEEVDKPEVPKPKSPVLKGALRLQPEQVRALVLVIEAGQSYLIRKSFHVPPDPAVLQAAAYTEEESDQLSIAACEALNRRAPRWLVENVDLVGLATTLIAIESRKIEAVQAIAERYRTAKVQNVSDPDQQQANQAPGVM